MKKTFNLLNTIETIIFILLFAKLLSLVVWWYLPEMGVESNKNISCVMPYQRIDFQNMLDSVFNQNNLIFVGWFVGVYLVVYLGLGIFYKKKGEESSFKKNAKEFDFKSISEDINKRSPDIIWVSLGAPKQEVFSSILVKYLEKGIIINVGAAFGFYSGLKQYKRAPMIFRKLSLEWLWRLLHFDKKTALRLFKEITIMPKIIIKELFFL
jgi:exopolysaccharide biosynthesis WecB/TagA/CpsF family protein